MYSRRSGSDNPPLILIILVGAMLVFGCYALWNGVTNYMREGGDAIIAAATEQVRSTRTAAVSPTTFLLPTFPPTWTPPPPCDRFYVTVDSALVRSCPDETCSVKTAFTYGSEICVLRHLSPDSDWYEVELDVERRSRDLGYMHRNVIAPIDPTLEPTITNTPLPTVTPGPTNTLPPTRTRAPTYTPTPTPTIDPNAPTPPPTLPYAEV